MAKKKTKNNKVDNELNFDDLGDINTDDLDFGELDDIDASDRSPSKAGIARELATETGRGFLDNLVKQTAKKSLPEEYSNNYYELMDYASFTKNTFDENKNKVQSSIYKLGKEVKKILPFQMKLLNNFLEKYETNFEQIKQESEEALRENSIQSNLSSIFDKQLEIQKAIEAKRDAEGQVETRERITTNKLNFDILTNIDSNISNQTAFTLQISKEYYRKSLELQFKSYFIQADMLKTMKDYYKGFSLQFDNIVKNTGLPEFVKLNSTERIQDVIRTQMVQNTYKSLFSNSKYVDNIKSKFSKLINDKISSITDRVDAVTDQLSMVNAATDGTGISSGELAGTVLSGLLGSTLGEKLADKISPKIKDKVKDNKYINTGANYMNLLGNSPSTLFSLLKSKVSNKQNEYTDEGTPIRYLKSKMFGGLNELLSVTDPGVQEYNVKTASILNHNKPAIFDNKVHRSITEVIPMYLSKILKENTDLREMYYTVNQTKVRKIRGSEELHYDYEGRKLVTGSTLKANIENSILASEGSKSKLKGVSNTLLTGSLHELNKNKHENKDSIKLLSNKNTDKLLNDYLSKASKIENIKFDYSTLVEEATSETAPTELKALLEDNPQLVKILEVLKNSTSSERTDNISNQLSDVKRKYPITAIKRLITDTSKISDNRVFNSIKDDQAEMLSKAFTIFITDVGRDVSIDNILSGEAFKFLTTEQFKKLKDVLTVFTSDVKSIKISDNIVKESSLTVLLGIVNRSLKDNFEVDPEVFQTLYEYSPILGKKGKLTVENLIERKLDQTENTELVSFEELRSTLRATRTEVNEIRVDVAELSFIDTIRNRLPELDINLTEARRNPFQFARTVIDSVKKATDELRQSSKTKYETLSKQMEEFKTSLGNMSGAAIVASTTNIIKRLGTTVASIDEMILLEKANRDRELAILNDTKNKLTETVNDPSELKAIEKDIKLKSKEYAITIGTLEQLKVILLTQRQNLINLQSEDEHDDINLLKRIRTEIMLSIQRTRELLNGTELKIEALA